MGGYLIDKNIFSWLADASHAHHDAVMKSYQSLRGNAPVFVSAITHGEVEYGVQAAPGMSATKREALYDALRSFLTLDVSEGTRDAYGQIRKCLFERYVRKGRRGLRPEQLTDPVTSCQLGVQENDIWITALAVAHRLTLVTHDAKMQPLWEAAGNQLAVVDWADASFVWDYH